MEWIFFILHFEWLIGRNALVVMFVFDVFVVK